MLARRSSRRAARAAVAVAGFVAAVVLSGCTSAPDAGSGTNYVAGAGTVTTYAIGHREAAPAISGTGLDGRALDLAAYRGKVVVLNFWASWCSPCRAEGPALQRLAASLVPKGVQFVGVDVRDDDAAAKAFLDDIGATYPSLADPTSTVAVRFNGLVPPQAIPSTIVIDRTGAIAARVIGGTTEPRLQALLAPIAAERA